MEKVQKQLFGESTLPSYHKIVTGVEENRIQEELNEESDDSSSSSDSSSEKDEKDVEQEKQD